MGGSRSCWRSRRSATRALLYQPGSNAILFLDLADLETRGGRNLEELSLEHPVARLLPMLDEHQVLVLHDDAGVSLVDLEARTVTLITSVAQLNDARFDAARRTLWFGPPAQPFVGLLDLKTGNTSEILLDANVQRLIPIFGAGQVAIVHDGKDGYLTLIDAERPARETTTTVRGFFE